MFRLATLLSFLTLLCACTTPGQTRVTPDALPFSVMAALNAAAIPIDSLGASVIRVSDGATLLSHRADASMQPASTLKPLTAIVALERLGPAYRGRTELRTTATLADGVLQGDLILRGLGDPDLDWISFRNLLQTLRDKGIREIRGDLLVDRNMFSPARRDLGVPPFDESPEFRYNVIPDALLLNTNLLQVNLTSTETGLAIRTAPTLDGVLFVSAMTLIDRACTQWEDGWKLPVTLVAGDGNIQVTLSGEYPRNCSATTEISVIDRTDFSDKMFRTLWREIGGSFSGRTREMPAGSAPTNTRLLAFHRSRSLAEVTRDINKRSDNPITRLTYLALGAQENSQGVVATETQSERAIRNWLDKNGIGTDGLVLDNGSGLSRTERIRPAQLAAVLVAAHRSPWAPEFQASFPIVAVDGGMERRLRDSPAAARSRIKTGTLRNASAVAGYVPDSSGQLYAVVGIINQERDNGTLSAAARPVLDALIDWVARR